MPGLQDQLSIVRDPAGAASLLHARRVQLLRHLAEPDSAAGLARRMGDTRQRINYHLRELEKDGLVEFVEERRRGNCVERLVRATARSYVISPEAIGLLGATEDEAHDRFSATYLVALAAQAVRDVADLRARAEAANRRLATFSLDVNVRFASADARAAFAAELTDAVAALSAKYHDEAAPNGRRFRFIVGGYPALAARPHATATTDASAAQQGDAPSSRPDGPAIRRRVRAPRGRQKS